jgi:hypothetical protein
MGHGHEPRMTVAGVLAAAQSTWTDNRIHSCESPNDTETPALQSEPMAKIFLNYRRRDTPGHTGRLYDHLIKYFGEREVFFDINGLRVGNFESTISKELKSCRVFIPVIGDRWSSLFDPSKSANDYVHKEIDFILSKNRKIDSDLPIGAVLVLPILVNNAGIPTETQVPAELHELLKMQMTTLDDRDFAGSVEKLVAKIEDHSRLRRVNLTEDVHTHCITCKDDRVHKQSVPTEDVFSHIRPDAEFEHESLDTNRSWTTHEIVRIRHCKGCGTPHLLQNRFHSGRDPDEPLDDLRFEINFNTHKKRR